MTRSSSTTLVGATVRHYRVLERLGGGGMGEVFLAEDERLGRRVALKFLPAHAAADDEARERLTREAKAAAALRSPHIAVTYELAEHDGAMFIAMEYVEGELLSARVAGGPMPVPDALDIALQVTDALEEAHGKGIVHRDIKSANMIITGRQLVKLLDFGLAKVTRPFGADEVGTIGGLTSPGVVLGTLNYMAPEQLDGGEVDHRTDLFSVGVVLYEMLTGKLPFPGQSLAQIADRLLHHEPDAIARHNPAVSHEVDVIVQRALQKRPEYRYQTARDFHAELAAVRRQLADASSRSWLTPIEYGDAALAMPVTPIASARRGKVVAVFTFSNITGQPADDWIGQGIAESLTADLTRVTSLSVVAREQIFELQRRLTESGRGLDDRQALEMGRRLGASVAVSGAYQRVGDRLRITAVVVDVDSGHQQATTKVDGRLEDLFDLQDRLVSEITATLSIEVPRGELIAMEGVGTQSIEAYQAFSRGMLNLRLAGRDSMERAISLFERAVELDPGYVEALVQLADALSLKAGFLGTPDLLPKSLALAERALNLAPDHADAHVQRGDTLLSLGRVDEGIAALERGVRLAPDDASAHGSLARGYWLAKGQVDVAIREFEHMLRLNPEAGYTYLQLAMLYTLQGEFETAERLSRSAIRLQDQAMSGTTGLIIVGAHTRLGYVLYRKKRYDEAIAEYRRELEMLAVGDHLLRERSSIELYQKLGAAYRRKGELDLAEGHEREAIERFDARLAAGADEPFTRYYLATLHALRGDAEVARAHLRLPLERFAAFTRWRLPRDPDFADVRSDPAFAGLV